MHTSSRTYHVVIKPHQSWFYFDWKGLVEYRDLLFLLVRRDFIARYEQTILGPAWFILNPIITTLIYTLVFSKVLGVSTGGVPPALFYLSGLVGWSYFSNVITATGMTFITSSRLFGKVYFPRLVVPFALGISNCITFGVQLGTFLFVYFSNCISGSFPFDLQRLVIALLVTPLCLIHLGIFAVGVGLLMSSLTAKYRDLQHLTPVMINMWMYATPVIYPASRIPAKFAWIANLNPVAPVIEALRSLYLGTEPMSFTAYGVSAAAAIGVFIVGILVFQRTARTFIDLV
jgi:lipopolysaccharide transport system permease protein